MVPDYYKILEISNTANDFEIKRAYRRLAKKYHPDVSTDSDAKIKFQLVNQAYQILINKDKRNFYDVKSVFEQSKQSKYYGVDSEKRAENYYKAKKAEEEYIRSYNKPIFDTTAFVIMFAFSGISIIFGNL